MIEDEIIIVIKKYISDGLKQEWIYMIETAPGMLEGVLLQHDPEVVRLWYHTTDSVPTARGTNTCH